MHSLKIIFMHKRQTFGQWKERKHSNEDLTMELFLDEHIYSMLNISQLTKQWCRMIQKIQYTFQVVLHMVWE